MATNATTPSSSIKSETLATSNIATRKTLTELFGAGRYHSLQCEIFRDTLRIFYGVTQSDNATDEQFNHAINVAKACATRVGAEMARGQTIIKGLDKNLNKDNAVKTLRDICTVKNLVLSNEVSYMRALDYLNKATAFHVVLGKVKLEEEVGTWFVSLSQ